MGTVATDRPLRVAVAGFGQAGQCHAATWKIMDDVEVVGIYSLRPDVERADIATVVGADVPVFAEFERMLDTVRPDFVSICTLHDSHADYAIAAAKRGIHFIVEKPICLTPEELVEVRRVVINSGVRAFVGFQEFHYGQLQATIDAVEKGYLGRVHLAEIEYFNGIGPWVRQHWWARMRAFGGSSMLFCGCHPLMMMTLVMQQAKVEEVSAFSTHSSSPHFSDFEYQATQINLLRFADGRVGKVTSCLDSLHPYYWRNTLVGSEGSLIDTKLTSRNMLAGLDNKGWTELSTRSINDAGDITSDMFTPMFGRILATLREDAAFPCSDFERAYQMHRVLFACDESARTGKAVHVDSFLPT